MRFVPHIRLSLPQLPSLALRDLGVGIGIGRSVLGAAFLADPELAVRVIGADSATAARVTWLSRMAAIRDLALGAGTSISTLSARRSARKGHDSTTWLLAGAICDAVDATAIATAARQHRLDPVRGYLGALLAAGAALLSGAAVVDSLRRR